MRQFASVLSVAAAATLSQQLRAEVPILSASRVVYAKSVCSGQFCDPPPTVIDTKSTGQVGPWSAAAAASTATASQNTQIGSGGASGIGSVHAASSTGYSREAHSTLDMEFRACVETTLSLTGKLETSGFNNEPHASIRVTTIDGALIVAKTLSQYFVFDNSKALLLDDDVVLAPGEYLLSVEVSASASGLASYGDADFEFTLAWTENPPSCGGDLDGSGNIDGADLGLLLAAWESAGLGDLDCNGVVDGSDLGALLAAWGACLPQ